MYKTFTAADYKKHFNLPANYAVEGFIVFGTFSQGPYEQLKTELAKLKLEVNYSRALDNPYFAPITEFIVNRKRYWFTITYGGAMLSEWTHLACLFGSKANIVIGNCGGLLAEANAQEIIVPSYSFANESATRMYEPNIDCKHASNKSLSQQLIKGLEKNYKIWNGPTVTCQAMMAETWEDVQSWSKEGYYGVEMESSTVFAVSNHFNVWSAALLVIGDNLIQKKTVLDTNYAEIRKISLNVRSNMLGVALKTVLDIN